MLVPFRKHAPGANNNHMRWSLLLVLALGCASAPLVEKTAHEASVPTSQQARARKVALKRCREGNDDACAVLLRDRSALRRMQEVLPEIELGNIVARGCAAASPEYRPPSACVVRFRTENAAIAERRAPGPFVEAQGPTDEGVDLIRFFTEGDSPILLQVRS